MKNDGISGGFFAISRTIFNSDIWEKPAPWIKLWLFIIGNAYFTTIKRGRRTFNRGELLVSYDQLREILSSYVGWRRVKCKQYTVDACLRYLKKEGMITTRRTTRGVFIKVVNYTRYQNLSSYEINNDNNTKTIPKQQVVSTINNNEKNDNNQEIYTTDSNPDKKQSKGLSSLKDILNKISRKIDPNIKYSWQEKAKRYAADLQVELNEQNSPRWYKVFKQASEGRKTKNIDIAYAYIKDHPNLKTSEDKFRMFLAIYERGLRKVDK